MAELTASATARAKGLDNTPTAQHLSLIHISEPTRLRRMSYAVFCLKKKKNHEQTAVYADVT